MFNRNILRVLHFFEMFLQILHVHFDDRQNTGKKENSIPFKLFPFVVENINHSFTTSLQFIDHNLKLINFEFI